MFVIVRSAASHRRSTNSRISATRWSAPIQEQLCAKAPRRRGPGRRIRFVAALIDAVILGVVSSALQLLLLGNVYRPLMNMQQPLPPDEAMAAFGAMLGTLALSMLVGVVISAAYE
jgi:hypothetical protein